VEIDTPNSSCKFGEDGEVGRIGTDKRACDLRKPEKRQLGSSNRAAIADLFGQSNDANLKDMSRQTTQLLEVFEALPDDDKRIFTAELLRRAMPYDSGPLDDQETACAAGGLFALLDAEENDTRSR
jgi:hypothetical protein